MAIRIRNAKTYINIENLMMLLSLKTTKRIPKEIKTFKAYRNDVNKVTLKTSRRGLSIYK